MKRFLHRIIASAIMLIALQITLTAQPVGSQIKTDTSGHISYWNGVDAWIPIAPGLPGQTLKFTAGVPSWVNNPNGITTTAVSNITETTAVSGGNILSDGGAKITARGVCWSTSANPTIADNKTIDGNGIGSFTSNFNGLIGGTTYFLRAYATNSFGTAYGNELSFTTTAPPVSTVTDYDGNVYDIITIGTQDWLKQNLKTTHYKNGAAITYPGTNNTAWTNNTTGAYAWYNNDETTYKNTYGALYNWYAVNTGNLCPTGWHVPTDAEWTTLTTYLGGESIAGGKLKATTLWNSPNTGASNSSGFTALPGGNRNNNGTYNNIGSSGLWWSSTEDHTSLAWDRSMYYNLSNAISYSNNKTYGFSVRCLRDLGAQASLPSVTTTAATAITSTTVTSGGNITSDGGAVVTARGVCWSTSVNPTITLSTKTSDGTGIGSFVSNITGLAAGTTYFLRAYATNSFGTAYGNELSFTTTAPPVSTVTDYDGNVYDIITIGTQDWLKQNLKTTHYKNGAAITYPGTNNTAWTNNTTGAYAWYNNDETTYKNTYGALYNWYAVNTGNLCPTGWHVPTEAEWTTLTDYLGGWSIAGGKLKATTLWNSPNTGATNSSGFTAFPGGFRYGSGTYGYVGYYGYWWSSTEYSASDAWARAMDYSLGNVYRDYYGKYYGFSVRCLRDLGAQASLPSVTTTGATDITSTTANSGGNITSDGGAAVTDRGVCWSTSPNPTIADNKTIDGNGIGGFTSIISVLSTGTTYYVRAYATNSAGTAYGNELSFTTTAAPITTVTDYDGNVYDTVHIGTQIWMKQNLKTTHYKNGTAIAYPGTDNTAWQNNTTGAYAWYNNDEATYKSTYGALYNWHAVNTGNLCPTGWHVPTDAEWVALETYLGGISIAGGKLKEAGLAHWLNPNTAATNETDFTALPGGYRFTNGSTNNTSGKFGYWWSSTEYNPANALGRNMYYNYGYVSRFDYDKTNGFSVRCLRDLGAQASLPTLSTSVISGITATTAISGGNITSDGGAAVTARGVCWSTSPNPTIADNKTIDGNGIGSFTSNITNLAAGTTYFLRAYATNSAGTAYGNELSFTTTAPPVTTVTDYDGNVYDIITIGTQDWLKQNLKTTHYKNGTAIAYPGTDNTAWQNNTTGAYAWYNNDETTYKNTYGALYNWYAVNTGNLCPTGWHVPTDAEWTTLTTYLGGDGISGGKLKETGLTHWISPNNYATNSSGFTALPGGKHSASGTYGFIGEGGFWWSSTEDYSVFSWGIVIYNNSGDAPRVSLGKPSGLSVRCLRD